MIHQKEVFRKIGAIIVEINEQYQYLSENPEQLNDLELELFSANADFLSEHVKILRRINKDQELHATSMVTVPSLSKTQTSIPEVPAETELETAPAATEPEKVVLSDQEPPLTEAQAPRTLFEPIEEPKPIDKPLSVEIRNEFVTQEIVEEKAPIVEEKQGFVSPPPLVTANVEVPVIKEVIIPEKVTTIDVTESTNSTPTVNDLISVQKAQSIQASQFSSQPIRDLKAAISLNDKLLFIKDLFNGYSLAYSEAIEILNRFESFDIAETFLRTNYATKNSWVTKQETVDKFYELLQRRYAK